MFRLRTNWRAAALVSPFILEGESPAFPQSCYLIHYDGAARVTSFAILLVHLKLTDAAASSAPAWSCNQETAAFSGCRPYAMAVQ